MGQRGETGQAKLRGGLRRGKKVMVRGTTWVNTPLCTAPTGKPPWPPLAGLAVPTTVWGANTLLWIGVELGDEIAARDAVARREVAVELAVERVAGHVLDAGQPRATSRGS